MSESSIPFVSAHPQSANGSDFGDHALSADEHRTLCGLHAGENWYRTDNAVSCVRCLTAIENSARRTVEPDPVSTAVMVALRAQLRKSMSRADWALTAYWSAKTDAEIALARERVAAYALEVDALYAEFAGSLASVMAS